MPNYTYWADWADQFKAELDKQASDRVGTLKSLLFSGDWDAIRDWVTQWENEDRQIGSIRYNHDAVRFLAKITRQEQRSAEAGGGSPINTIYIEQEIEQW